MVRLDRLRVEDAEDTREENLEELNIEIDSHLRFPDDGFTHATAVQQTRHLLESITRIGGEVCRLRAEVDGLLESHGHLQESLRRLRDVISEKGHLDLDDFELACDVMAAEREQAQSALAVSIPKKLAH